MACRHRADCLVERSTRVRNCPARGSTRFKERRQMGLHDTGYACKSPGDHVSHQDRGSAWSGIGKAGVVIARLSYFAFVLLRLILLPSVVRSCASESQPARSVMLPQQHAILRGN